MYNLAYCTHTSTMVTAISAGVKISVDCQFESKFSNPENNLYMFSYHIKIENRNAFTVRLERRKWHITDSAAPARTVEGEGVVGKQPLIPPGGTYTYRSSCDFSADTGCMNGVYLMRNVSTNALFEVEVPSFMLMVPHKLN